MDLITNIAASVFAFAAGLLTNILAHDICVSADRVCTKIIRRAARRLAPFDQEPLEVEWLGDLSERETVYEKYRHAVGCYIAASGMRRRALTVIIAMNFRVISVGAVPLTLNLGPPLFVSAFFAATGPKMPRWLRTPLLAIFIAYTFAKLFLSVHRLGPGSLHRFLSQLKLKEYKKWEYEARIVRKGTDLDLSKIFRAMVLDPKRIPQIVKALNDALSKKDNLAP